MNLLKRYFFLCFIIFFSKAQAQQDSIALTPRPPKREFRGVWVATVANIDWPSSGRTSADRQKQELVNIFNNHQQTGINAIMFQIRPAADAFYAKSREPWSKWLTGVQGKSPNPLYDPLEFAVDEAHKRGMELHAWFNPYRATLDGNYAGLSPQHITNTHPEWFFVYGGQKLFNPGLPEVREYIVRVILDVVDNYDIDGVHMDDYFYPYLIAGQKINDAAAYEKYGSEFAKIGDWRRNSVDLLIKTLNDSIHVHKPKMKFGVSPRAIWKNKYQDPEGSDTHGGDAYYENYADTRKWVKEGWVDYMNPQIYFQFGNRNAAYEKLVDWWGNNAYGRHMYIGQAAYRINETRNPGFRQPSQLPDQIKYLRNNPRIQGSVFFSSASLRNNLLGFTDSLRTKYYNIPALPPVMLWLDSVAPNAPRLLTARQERKGVILKWQAPLRAADGETAYGYVVYRFNMGEEIDLNDPKHILHIQYNEEPSSIDESAEKGNKYVYVVTAIDRIKNESRLEATATVTIR